MAITGACEYGIERKRPTNTQTTRLLGLRPSLAAEWQQAQRNPPPVLEDPDKAAIDRLFPQAMKVGDPFAATEGPLKGNGRCIRRKLTPNQGVLFTIRYSDGVVREWHWYAV